MLLLSQHPKEAVTSKRQPFLSYSPGHVAYSGDEAGMFLLESVSVECHKARSIKMLTNVVWPVALHEIEKKKPHKCIDNLNV